VSEEWTVEKFPNMFFLQEEIVCVSGIGDGI
jgi:hypothetical protein